MIGWMIYRREDAEKNKAYIRWFQEEGKCLGMEIELKILEDFELEQVHSLENWSLQAQFFLGQTPPDFVLNRSRNAEVAKKLEALNVRCVNSSRVTRIANDKAATYEYFQKKGIPMLSTCAAIVDNELPNQKLCGYPLVVKSVDGHGGNEVFLVENKSGWKPVMDALFGRKVVLQKPCGLPGRDLRIFVLGGEVIAAVLRESDQDFRANYSLGGRIRLAQLTEEQSQMVEKICAVFPMEWGGVDLLFDSEEVFYLNEIEDAVGSRSLSKLTELNIARMVLAYIEESHLAK